MDMRRTRNANRVSMWLTAALLGLAAVTAGCGAAPTSPTPGDPPVTTPPEQPPPPPPPTPPTLRYTKIVAFGDSMTEGVTASLSFLLLLDPSQAYPSKLQGKLLARYTAQAITVWNEGKAGEWAATGVSRLPGVVTAHRPEIVILMEGVNDLNNGARLTTTVNWMEEMVKTCTYQGIAVMLAGIPPQVPGGLRAGSADRVTPYNERLRAMALAKGAEFVDIEAAFGGDLSLISSDGLHPNAAGYERMAQTFYDRIVALYEQPAASASRAAR
jgi:acyl-CoA thioesterase I